MSVSENTITSFDSSAISVVQPRGLFLGSVTAAQVTAGAYVFFQEQGIGTGLVTTATATAIGSIAAAGTGGTITTTTSATWVPSALGQTIDVAAASTLTRIELALPIRQG
jgi:hypothetical protein